MNRKVPVDLETICLKAMEKDPDRRYSTAKELADDLRRMSTGLRSSQMHRPAGKLRNGRCVAY